MQDLKASLKNKETLRKDTIQIIRAAILQAEKDSKTVLDDAAVIDIIAKELKKRVDTLPDYERSGREDRIGELKAQIEIIKSYLPQQLEADEILSIVRKAVTETGASSIKDMGKVMGVVSPQVKGRADMKLVGDIVRKAVS
jgi:uncharacterized protein YqeY